VRAAVEGDRLEKVEDVVFGGGDGQGLVLVKWKSKPSRVIGEGNPQTSGGVWCGMVWYGMVWCGVVWGGGEFVLGGSQAMFKVGNQ